MTTTRRRRQKIANQMMPENSSNSNDVLRDVDALSQRVLDSLTAEVAVLNQNGTIIAVNKAWNRFAAENGGQPEKTGVGVNYFEICRKADGDDSIAGELVSEGVKQVLDGSQDVFKFEYPCHSPTQQRWFLLHVSRLDANDAYVVTAHLPITERKLTEQRLVVAERLAAIGEAMRGLSHEGRNTLQRAQAAIALLRYHLEGNSEALELIQRIENSLDHLLGLYEEVRNYAAPIVLRHGTCRLDELVNLVWQEFAASEKSVRLGLDIQTDDLSCDIDADAIARVLHEIFKNALAAVDESESPEIEVSFVNDVLEGLPAVTLIVSDNGCGVPNDDREKAFQPFFTTKTQGTGLGLAFANRIVSEHDGRIQFGAPRLDDGASVYITLPMRRSSP